MAKPLTKKEAAELKKLNRLILVSGRGTRKQVLRAMDLRRQDIAAKAEQAA